MRVRAKTQFVDGDGAVVVVHREGDIFNVSDEAGMAYLRAGHVERVESIPETAALNRGERAVRVARPVR